MARVPLVELAHTRSGDKGDTANVGVIAYDPAHFPLLVEQLHALNFLLHGALGGGGTVSLMTDAQGKVFSTALLRMEIEVPQEVADAVRGRGRVPPDLEGG
jgi:hypothetical protein